MKRKEFLTSACTLGMCSCAGLSLLSARALCAATDDSQKQDPDWKMKFIHVRFAALLGILNSKVDQGVKNSVLEDVGRACARENAGSFEKFKGNPQDYLNEIKSKWVERADYDASKGSIRIVGKRAASCFCPLVDGTITPKDFCSCSAGYNKQVFETILGHPVDVAIEESILRGGERCTHVITIA